MAEIDENEFKKEFKRFRRPKEEDMKCVLDFSSPENYDEICEENIQFSTGHSLEQCQSLGLHLPENWKIFKLKSTPGLLFIPNPFISGHQHYWIGQCLKEYPCLPNVSNLDSHIKREGNGEIWPSEEQCSLGAAKLNKDSLLYKLRWVTLGYHYDWNNKLYYRNNYTPFPTNLSKLTQFILQLIGYATYRPEAAIVNYYHLDSTLSGHTDHSEHDLTAPLISISFGQEAIFLIGGPTKQVKPLPLLIRSGDIIIMSRESRLSYHGIPKVLTPNNAHPIPECISKRSLSLSICNGKKKTCLFCSKEQLGSDQVACGMKHSRGFSDKDLKEKKIKLHNEADDEQSETETNTIKQFGSETDTLKDFGSETETNTFKDFGSETETNTFKDFGSETETNTFKDFGSETETNTFKDFGSETETNTFKEFGSETDTLKQIGSETDGLCQNCQWLFNNWEYFETYLSYSRININVRQVGDINEI